MLKDMLLELKDIFHKILLSEAGFYQHCYLKITKRIQSLMKGRYALLSNLQNISRLSVRILIRRDGYDTLLLR